MNNYLKKCCPTKILIALDAGVENYQMLTDIAVKGARVIVLERDRDGVEQITETIDQLGEIDSLHIISQGCPGCLYLGNTQLNLDTLNLYAPYLFSWFFPSVSYRSTPFLLLYGCNVAVGDAGTKFIERLHQLTAANIVSLATDTGISSLSRLCA